MLAARHQTVVTSYQRTLFLLQRDLTMTKAQIAQYERQSAPSQQQQIQQQSPSSGQLVQPMNLPGSRPSTAAPSPASSSSRGASSSVTPPHSFFPASNTLSAGPSPMQLRVAAELDFRGSNAANSLAVPLGALAPQLQPRNSSSSSSFSSSFRSTSSSSSPSVHSISTGSSPAASSRQIPATFSIQQGLRHPPGPMASLADQALPGSLSLSLLRDLVVSLPSRCSISATGDRLAVANQVLFHLSLIFRSYISFSC